MIFHKRIRVIKILCGKYLKKELGDLDGIYPVVNEGRMKGTKNKKT